MGKRANGEGTIYKRTDGRWCATVSVEGGKRKSFYGRRREDVAKQLASALKAKQDGLPLPADRLTVARFLADWLDSVRPTLRPSTHMRYEQLVRDHALPAIGRLQLSRVQPEHLQRLYTNRLEAGQSASSVRQLHAVLHRAFKQATRWGRVGRSVVDLVSPPRVERKEMTALSPDQARQLLTAAQGEPLEALYVLALNTGMRQGEILALHWRDVDLQAGMLQVKASLQRTPTGHVIGEPKTSKSRRQIALTRAATEALRRHKVAQAEDRLRLGAAWQDLDLVFTDKVGGFIREWNLRKQSFLPLLRQANLPKIRFHDLRHTAATLLLGRGIHPKIVSEMLGHAQISVTLDLYSHVTPTMQREATDALDAVLGG